MKKLMSILVVLLLSVAVAACAGGNDNTSNNDSSGTEGEKITVKHQLGETPVKKNPQKVVVFDFGTLDTLDKLGVNVTGVPQASTVPSYLSKFAGEPYVNVGSLQEPDFETIFGLKPDLIIISGRQSAMYEDLTEIAPTIFMGVDNANYMESFQSNVKTLGEIFGKEEAAEAELTKVADSVTALHDKMSTSEENGLIILVTGGKISAYGPGSRFGIIHDEFGVKPVDDTIVAETHGMSISYEYIVEKNPDYLFVVDRDAVVGDAAATSAASVLDNELIRGTKAYKNDNIIYLDPQYWYLSGGGIVSVSEMLQAIEAGVQ